MLIPTILCISFFDFIPKQDETVNTIDNSSDSESEEAIYDVSGNYPVPVIMNGTSQEPKTTTTTTQNTTEIISMPPIVIVQDDSGMMHAEAVSDFDNTDTSFSWLVVSKKTSVNRVEEESSDFMRGKNRRVITEDRSEELRVYRDNQHRIKSNGIDISNILRL
ncbi:uncharacterized protein TNCT_574491 [Trichonephila clavata]|uniref:Uncharacterized protein n=1 Tax=Trichonephila clavata TaxID=2740835 RepID=A0A8X6HML2_TRICU|nr:uncharacterized protein TNCT_574491 [Trichonephila clavata]